jgi:SAM-dependent methyltransferase
MDADVSYLRKLIMTGHNILNSIKMAITNLVATKKPLTVGTTNESNRIVWLTKTLETIPPGLRILDAGAGELQFKRLCSHLEYVSQDFAQYDGKGDGSGLHTGTWNYPKLDIVSDITSIPEPDSSFDAIMCVEVFEHLPNPVQAIKEFSRLLKKGGHLILTAPFCSFTHFAPYHFITGYNRYFYETNLKDSGFNIIEISENGNYFEFLAQELRRVDKVAEKYCKNKVTIKEDRAIDRLLNMLQRFSNNDSNSKELLCFGYHVHAVKK